MPIRTQCPSCKTALGAPDTPGPQRLRCPFCSTIFTAGGDDFTLPGIAPAPPPPPPARQMLQTARDRRPAILKEPAPSARERGGPPVPRKSKPVPVGLLLGIGAGLVGALILFVGFIVLVLMVRSPDPAPSAGPSQPAEEVVQAGGGRLAADAGRPAGPQAVPEAPAAAGGGEEFVDLPERGADLPGIAGLNPDPPGAGGAPDAAAADLRVNLLGGRVARITRRTGRLTQSGTFLQVQYRFERGVPTRTQSFGLVITPARGPALKMMLVPGALNVQGTITSAALPTGAGDLAGPYRVILILAAPGRPGAVETISNELTIR